jgi:hypothetical protein
LSLVLVLDAEALSSLAGKRGPLGGIETGVRQMVRQRPLEVEEVAIGGRVLRVPTLDEILRIKAWLVVSRNQTRDHLDAAALSDRIGIGPAVRLLARMDDWGTVVETLRAVAIAMLETVDGETER